MIGTFVSRWNSIFLIKCQNFWEFYFSFSPVLVERMQSWRILYDGTNLDGWYVERRRDTEYR